MNTSFGNEVLRYIPDHLTSGSNENALTAELSQSIFSWKGGLRPVRTRIEALSQLEVMISNDLNRSLQSRQKFFEEQNVFTCQIANDVEVLSICCSNAKRFVDTGPRSYICGMFKLIRGFYRRRRIAESIVLVDSLCEMRRLICSTTKLNSVDTVSAFRRLIESVPPELRAVSNLQAGLTAKIAEIREELIDDLCRIGCEKYLLDFANALSSELSRSYGLSPGSILQNDAVFWYCAPVNEDSRLAEIFTQTFLHRYFTAIMAGETWEGDRPMSYMSRSGRALLIIFDRLEETCSVIPVVSDELIARIKKFIGEIYWLYVFMSFCGSDFSRLLFRPVEEDLASAHEVWLRNGKFKATKRFILDPRSEGAISLVNRIKRRPSESIKYGELIVAAESVKALSADPVVKELQFAIYSTLAMSGLTHAFERWREGLLESDLSEFDACNEELVFEICSFLQAVTPKQKETSIGPHTDSVIVTKLLDLIADCSLKEERSSQDWLPNVLAELVRDLQAKLISVGIPVKNSEWTLIYQSIQMLSMDSGQLVLAWVTEETLRVPLKVLAAILHFCESEEDTRIELLEALEHQVANICYSQN